MLLMYFRPGNVVQRSAHYQANSLLKSRGGGGASEKHDVGSMGTLDQISAWGPFPL